MVCTTAAWVFRALPEQMETTTSAGKLIFHVFGALAEFERELVQERTKAGLKAGPCSRPLGWTATKYDGRKGAPGGEALG